MFKDIYFGRMRNEGMGCLLLLTALAPCKFSTLATNVANFEHKQQLEVAYSTQQSYSQYSCFKVPPPNTFGPYHARPLLLLGRGARNFHFHPRRANKDNAVRCRNASR